MTVFLILWQLIGFLVGCFYNIKYFVYRQDAVHPWRGFWIDLLLSIIWGPIGLIIMFLCYLLNGFFVPRIKLPFLPADEFAKKINTKFN